MDSKELQSVFKVGTEKQEVLFKSYVSLLSVEISKIASSIDREMNKYYTIKAAAYPDIKIPNDTIMNRIKDHFAKLSDTPDSIFSLRVSRGADDELFRFRFVNT